MSEDLQWLETLSKELIDFDKHSYCGPQKRQMTDDELKRIFDIVEQHKLPVLLFNLNTSIGCEIYENPPSAPCPGIAPKDLIPRSLIWLCAGNLPPSEAHSGYNPKHPLWEDGWMVYSKLSHTDENIELCRSCGIEEPTDKGRYAY